jgi:hypothetical protein
MFGHPPIACQPEIAKAKAVIKEAAEAAAGLQRVLLELNALRRQVHLRRLLNEPPNHRSNLTRAQREVEWQHHLLIAGLHSRKARSLPRPATSGWAKKGESSGRVRLNDLDELKRAIHEAYSCGSRFIGSIHVREIVNPGLVWDGIVDVFGLINCPRAERCYAWTQGRNGRRKVLIVLRSFPVSSAAAAVRSTMANS